MGKWDKPFKMLLKLFFLYNDKLCRKRNKKPRTEIIGKSGEKELLKTENSVEKKKEQTII